MDDDCPERRQERVGKYLEDIAPAVEHPAELADCDEDAGEEHEAESEAGGDDVALDEEEEGGEHVRGLVDHVQQEGEDHASSEGPRTRKG